MSHMSGFTPCGGPQLKFSSCAIPSGSSRSGISHIQSIFVLAFSMSIWLAELRSPALEQCLACPFPLGWNQCWYPWCQGRPLLVGHSQIWPLLCWMYLSARTYFWISVTWLQTHVFHLNGSLWIQLSVTIESVQHRHWTSSDNPRASLANTRRWAHSRSPIPTKARSPVSMGPPSTWL